VVGDDGKLNLTDPTMVASVQWYADLTGKEKVSPQLAGTDAGFAENQFMSGTAAMGANGPWSLLTIKSQASFELGLATIPAGPEGTKTYSAGSGFGISKDCQAPDEAYQAIATMTSAQSLGKLGAEGRAFPARKSVQQSWYDNANIAGAKETLDAAAASAIPLRTTKNWKQVSTLTDQYGIPLFNGQATAQESLETIQNQAGQG
jgi:multiple sugar transport system substrate-binding protein